MKRLFVWAGVVLAATLSAATGKAAFPGANGKIAVTGQCQRGGTALEQAIIVMDPDGSNRECIVELTETDGNPPYGPAWSPDGQILAFVARGDIYLSDPEGSETSRLTINRDAQGPVRWSPDGQQILFTYNNNVWVMDVDGTNQDRVAYRGQQAAWAPNGGKIAFVDFSRSDDRDRNGNQIFTMRPGGSDRRRLTRGIRPANFPAWSPDGRRIVFSRGSFSGAVLVVMKRNGTREREITAGRRGDLSPAWSPDGRWIVFARGYYVSEPRLMKVRPNGSGLTALTEEEEFIDAPDWQPL